MPAIIENVDRAERARAALEHYNNVIVGGEPDMLGHAVTDLLTDLRHLLSDDTEAHYFGSFEAAITISEMHFEAEHEEHTKQRQRRRQRRHLTLVFLRGHARLRVAGMTGRGSIIKKARTMGYTGPATNKGVLDWTIAELDKINREEH